MKQVKESQPQPNDRYQSTNFNSANGNPGGGRWSNSGGGGGGGFRRPNDGTAIIHFSLFSLKFVPDNEAPTRMTLTASFINSVILLSLFLTWSKFLSLFCFLFC